MKKFKWICECSDGAYYEECNKGFATKKECYEDMRDAALKKMKWNTEYDEDLDEECPIGYKVSFAKDEITHESYSGIYTYRIVDATLKQYRVEIPFMGTMTYEVEAYTEDEAREKGNILLWKDSNENIALNASFDDAQIYEL